MGRIAFVLGVIVAALIWIFYHTHLLTLPYAAGLWLIIGLWVLYSLVSGDTNPATLVEGADRRPSTSKLQWLLWTVVALFAYTVVATALMLTDGALPQNFPSGLLIAMGLSFGTMTAAKGITVAYLANGRITKPSAASPAAAGATPLAAASATPSAAIDATPPAAAGAQGLAALIQDDNGVPDLSKAQMLAWTVVAIVFFLWQLSQKVAQPKPVLPDIDSTLVVLMGLGQGAYIGKKLVTTDTSRLTGLTPPAANQAIIAKGDTEVTLTGMAFGDQQAGSYITLDGMQFQGAPRWADTQIVFKLPTKRPNGVDWRAGDRVAVNLTVGGRDANPLYFTVTG